MKKLLLTIFLIIPLYLISQNIAITDDEAYSPDSSAMLDVKSTTKGMLIPRLSTNQREAISNPAQGLLVFDTDSTAFYFYGDSVWINLTSANPSNVWSKNAGNIFLSDTTYKLGVGTLTPTGKLIIQADNSISVNDPLFEVKDKDGQTVFAVHNDGVRIYVDEDAKGNIGGFAVSGRTVTKGIKDYAWITKDSVRFYLDDSGKGNIGGFAVSGRTVTKGAYDEFLRVTPDSTRIYVSETSTKGNIGGFAVSGRTVTKGKSTEYKYLHITPDSTRVYIKESGTKGNIGGFAVSGRTVTKGNSNEYLRVTADSTRVWVKKGAKGNIGGFAVSGRTVTKGTDEPMFVTTFDSTRVYVDSTSAKGNIGGFAVSGRTVTKGKLTNFMDLTPDNYFIGHNSGTNIHEFANGNCTFGYLAGTNLNYGSRNILIGYESGYNCIDADNNCLFGWRAGKGLSSGSNNIFLGTSAGLSITNSTNNIFMGKEAGAYLTSGNHNILLGNYIENINSGEHNAVVGTFCGPRGSSNYNVILGSYAGLYSYDVDSNVFIGYKAGYFEDNSQRLYIENSTANSSGALIYGEFDNNLVRINEKLGIGRSPASNAIEVNGDASKTFAGTWLANSDKRIKTDIQDITDAKELLLKLHPVKFKYTNEWKQRNPSIEDHYYYNFIAQEFKQVFPESVKGSGEYLNNDTEEILQMDAYNAIIVTIKASQELIKENQELKKQINDLQNKNNMLDKRIEKLEKLMQ